MINIDIHKKLKASDGIMQLSFQSNIENGSFVCIYGPSGAGKTSTIRMLSGLMRPDEGSIFMQNQCWFDSNQKINLLTQKRPIGVVLQDYALFPNMTVEENLRFALRKGDDLKRIEELIDIVELGDLRNRMPHQLSGGQQQRVAVARALVRRPKLLLLDEPLSALDQEMRQKLQSHILELHRKFELTSILISHDVSEIIRICDRMIVLEKGKVVQDGTPEKIFTQKKINSKFQFTGELIGIEKQDIIYVLTLLIGSEIVKVVADPSEVKDFKIGDKILTSSKAFNPIIQKLD